MKFKIIIRPEAENDLKEAYSWYEGKRNGLGDEFLLNIEAGLNFIGRNPFIHAEEYKESRKHLIKRFPYKIIYFTLDESIIILAVIHGKRKPDLTKKRVENPQ
jgi:plasmid stabilization system protein ParE